jgi:hypothetical protein
MSAAVTNQTAAAFNGFYSWCAKPQARKYLLILILINFANYLSVLRANFLYRDDVTRVVTNQEGWDESGRYLSYFLSKILFFGANADASPLAQIIAILIISASSLIICYALFKKRPVLVIFLAPICIFPYTLENLSYKFDAPWMSLAIAAAITPVIFFSSRYIFPKIVTTFFAS